MRHNVKLAPWFYSLFRVVQRLGSMAYKLDLPSTSRVHPVFHVSCLKKKLGDQIKPLPSLPPTNDIGEVLSPRLCWTTTSEGKGTNWWQRPLWSGSRFLRRWIARKFCEKCRTYTHTFLARSCKEGDCQDSQGDWRWKRGKVGILALWLSKEKEIVNVKCRDSM